MRMKHCRHILGTQLDSLEARIACTVIPVWNTKDYDPALYDPSNLDTYEPGSFRYAIQQAMDKAGQTGLPSTITFNKTAGPGLTDFSQPNTEIPLTYGKVRITDSVVIDAPKTHDNPAFDFVTIRNANTITFEPRGSVFDISIANTVANEPTVPDYNYSVGFRGIRIKGGEAKGSGGGINAFGFFSLNISTCEIVDNATAKSDAAGTFGGGIHADGSTPGTISQYGVAFGPKIDISNTLISKNGTYNNQDFADVGGAMYLGVGCSLTMANCDVSDNNAEDGYGGIYFAGGQFDTPQNSSGKSFFFTTDLHIINCDFVGNATTHGNAGALAIDGPTGGGIGATTFAENIAGGSGGAVWIGGSGSLFNPPGFGSPYQKYIGQVDIADCTFDGNVAARIAKDSEGQVIAIETGKGGAIYSDGVANRVFVFNSTLKGNSTEVGRGGAIAVAPTYVYFEHWTQYLRAPTYKLTLDPDQDHDQPPGIPTTKRHTHFEIDNATIAENTAGGFVDNTDPGSPVVLGARGGGLAVMYDMDDPWGKVVVNSTIIAKNTVTDIIGIGPDGWGSDTVEVFVPGEANVIGIGDDGNLTLVGQKGTLAAELDPKLGRYDYHGGTTKNFEISFTSPAYDQGVNRLSLAKDQRLKNRVRGPQADVGAYEAINVAFSLTNFVTINGVDYPTEYFDEELMQGQQSMINALWAFSDEVDPDLTFHVFRLADNLGNSSGEVAIAYSQTPDPVGLITYEPWSQDLYRWTIRFEDSSHVEDKGGILNALKDGLFAANAWHDFGDPPQNVQVTPSFQFARLFGDAVADFNFTDLQDFLAFRANNGSTINDPNYDPAFDFDGNGFIDLEDFLVFRSYNGKSVGPP